MADLFATGYRYYYSQLPPHMKAIYMNIYNGLAAQRTAFSFAAEKHNGIYPPVNVIIAILNHVLLDNPALYYVGTPNVQVYYTFAAMGVVRITYTEYYSPAQRAQIEQDLLKRVNSLLAGPRRKIFEHHRLYDLYRRVVAIVNYDYDALKMNNHTQRKLESATVLGPLLRNSAICAGYTQAFKFLCDQLGIGCLSIHGTAKSEKGWEPHAWNIITMQGRFYHLDVTYDSGYYHASHRYTRDYYLRGDESMLKDHQWDRSKFPPMLNDYR